eukprot:2220305-Amphidinium_carterae.1
MGQTRARCELRDLLHVSFRTGKESLHREPAAVAEESSDLGGRPANQALEPVDSHSARVAWSTLALASAGSASG